MALLTDGVSDLVALLSRGRARLHGARTTADAGPHPLLHDPLTGLPNRESLLRLLSEQLAAPGRVVVLLCGVTGLDEVVVVDGHEAGDEVVRRVADGLRPAVTGAAALGRLSGDVLAVVEVLADGDPHEHLQRRFADLGTRLANVGGLPARVRVAMGAVVAGDDACPEDLLRDGTAALHRAAGGGGPEVFDDALRHRLRTRAATEEALRHAVARDEIEVHYQPLVDARTREVTSYEALARWRRGSELVPPLDWIPLAEEAGLIGDIGLRVLSIACRDQAVLGVPVAVNVSAHQLADELFPDDVLVAVGDCSPAMLTLEVTESALMSDVDRAVRSLTLLRAAGIQVALDDFGTSYSSLAVLSTLPVDVLKIDRAFVTALDVPAGRAVLGAIVALARAVGMSTVAEGVETRAQLRSVQAAGVDRVQGWLTGRPAPVAAHGMQTPGAALG
ncbi:putative bifunctional diguanylate cyclase/phosphodiesterase [Angustibacter aerolatus]